MLGFWRGSIAVAFAGLGASEQGDLPMPCSGLLGAGSGDWTEAAPSDYPNPRGSHAERKDSFYVVPVAIYKFTPTCTKNT